MLTVHIPPAARFGYLSQGFVYDLELPMDVLLVQEVGDTDILEAE